MRIQLSKIRIDLKGMWAFFFFLTDEVLFDLKYVGLTLEITLGILKYFDGRCKNKIQIYTVDRLNNHFIVVLSYLF